MAEPKNLLEMMSWLDSQNVDAGQRGQYMRRFLDLQARRSGTPLSGTFEITPLCNFNCGMCYVHLCREQLDAGAMLSADVWRGFMSQAIDEGMLYAALTGGECLTHPGIRDLILFLHSKGVGYSLLTNGSLLDEDMAAFLAEHKPINVQVTLYGSNEETYARVTGCRAFSRVISGVERLRAAGIHCEMAITPNALAGHDLVDQIHLIHRMGLSLRINSSLFPARKETGRNSESMEISLSQYLELFRIRAELAGDDSAAIPASECDRGELQPRAGLTCGAGRSSFSISWDGRMYPCNMLRSISANLLKESFHTAWQTVHEGALAYPLPVECATCRYHPIAKNCAAEHAMGAPPGHANPAVCEWCKRMVQDGFVRLPNPSA